MHGHSGAPHHHARGDSWDDLAPAYARNADQAEPKRRAVTEALLDAAGATPGTRLLDLACGPGHTTAAAHARGANVLGVDRSAGMIFQARQRFPGVPFAVGDMATPPAGPWDAIMCRDAHHADPAWMVAAFRVLRSAGRIALAETEPEGPGDQGGKVEASEWVRRLEEAGFVGVTSREFHVGLPDRANQSDAFGQAQVSIIAGSKP